MRLRVLLLGTIVLSVAVSGLFVIVREWNSLRHPLLPAI
jgi:hypothetical protein